MEVHNCVTHKLARELAEKKVYMGYWFELEPFEDKEDTDHVYGRVQAFTGEGTMQDYAFILAADYDAELNEMWEELQRLIRKFVSIINYSNEEK